MWGSLINGFFSESENLGGHLLTHEKSGQFAGGHLLRGGGVPGCYLLDLLRSRVPFRAFAYFVTCSIINNVNYYNLDDCDDRR